MVPALGAVVLGIAILAIAADQFVIGAARVAVIRRVPSIVVGVIIVGFGTSVPELLVSTLAVIGDSPEIAVGNIVGSNIANLSLLLGIGAMIVPLTVDSRTVKAEAPLTVAAVLAFAVAVQGGGVNRVEGILLILAMAGALLIVVRRGKVDPISADVESFAAAGDHRLPVELIRVVVGLAGTVGAAQLLLWGATDLAGRAGLSEGFVGATLVAVGTSLPELVTVLQSARRGETDLIVGNLLGSNMFNALVVGGVIGVIGSPAMGDTQLAGFGAVAAAVVAAVALVAMVTGHTVGRREGIALVAGYFALVPFIA